MTTADPDLTDEPDMAEPPLGMTWGDDLAEPLIGAWTFLAAVAVGIAAVGFIIGVPVGMILAAVPHG